MADHEHEHPHDHDHDHDHAHGTETISFAAFVLSLAHTAAVHFGDIPDPMSGQMSEANLPAAQQMIDILSLLDAKTRGNLSAEERQLLEQILYELRLRFVEASKPQSRIITP
jgi:ABC-type Zn2+ transport system substrate-binding protein/surface adhesin